MKGLLTVILIVPILMRGGEPLVSMAFLTTSRNTKLVILLMIYTKLTPMLIGYFLGTLT
jgi:hypothetical protein